MPSLLSIALQAVATTLAVNVPYYVNYILRLMGPFIRTVERRRFA